MLFDIEDTFLSDCQLALYSETADYEDAIMVQTALRVNCSCIVTRNPKDYSFSEIPVFSPEQFLTELLNNENTDK